MATTPQPPPPKHEPPQQQAKPPEHEADAVKPAEHEDKPAELKPDDAFSLFHNGERIAKVGDPKEKWITMGRAGDGSMVIESPMTPEFEKQIREGKYYKVD